jgi:hypothetical protein
VRSERSWQQLNNNWLLAQSGGWIAKRRGKRKVEKINVANRNFDKLTASLTRCTSTEALLGVIQPKDSNNPPQPHRPKKGSDFRATSRRQK